MSEQFESVGAAWRCYRDSCYPDGISTIQSNETHQAFFAGALVVLGSLSVVESLPNAKAVQFLSRLRAEILEENRQKASEFEQRN